MVETLTYASHRLLMSAGSTAREFGRADISPSAPVNGNPPPDDVYQPLAERGFADWRLSVDGLVARPGALSLAELQDFPARSQITHLACEEGWSYIAEWTGVPLAQLLDRVGVLPQAKYVVVFSLDPGWWDSIDMSEARHPQTLLAYGMNGDELPTAYGAPLRLRVPRQLGYKNVKYLLPPDGHRQPGQLRPGFGIGGSRSRLLLARGDLTTHPSSIYRDPGGAASSSSSSSSRARAPVSTFAIE